MPHYIQSDGPSIEERGSRAVKEPHTVFLVESDVPFSVSTNEGTVSGNAGDYVAYDPTSGHLWPVSAEYVDMHYRWLGDNEDLSNTKQEQEWHERLQELEDARSELETQNQELLDQLRNLQEEKAQEIPPPEVATEEE